MSRKIDFDEEYFRPYWQDEKRISSYRKEIEWINKRVSGVGQVLDFGCGLGLFSKELMSHGYKVYSCDVSSYAVEICRKEVNPDTFVVPSNFLQDFGPGVFDMIVIRGVFQHLTSPTETLMELKESLRIGGYLVILATPNVESVLFRVTGALPTLSWDVVRNLPSLSSIKHALEYSGFAVLDTQKPYFFSGYASPLKDFLGFVANLLGFKRSKVRAFPGNVVNVLAERLK